MKKVLPILAVLAFITIGCASSEFAFYRPSGSTESQWQIKVEKSNIGQNFKVIVNDSTVIDKGANFFTGNLNADGTYRGHKIDLVVTYSSGFLGIGSGYTAMVTVDNELAAQFKF